MAANLQRSCSLLPANTRRIHTYFRSILAGIFPRWQLAQCSNPSHHDLAASTRYPACRLDRHQRGVSAPSIAILSWHLMGQVRSSTPRHRNLFQEVIRIAPPTTAFLGRSVAFRSMVFTNWRCGLIREKKAVFRRGNMGFMFERWYGYR